MKENLSKCPFCGGEDMVMVDIELHGGMRETCIECRSCGATGPSTLQGEEKAVEGWNTRDVKEQNAAKE